MDSGAAAVAQAGALLTQGRELLGEPPTSRGRGEPVGEPPVQPTTHPGEPTTSPTKQAAARPTGEPTPESTAEPSTPTATGRLPSHPNRPPSNQPWAPPRIPQPQTLDLSAIGDTLDIATRTPLPNLGPLGAGHGHGGSGRPGRAQCLTNTFDIWPRSGDALGIDTDGDPQRSEPEHPGHGDRPGAGGGGAGTAPGGCLPEPAGARSSSTPSREISWTSLSAPSPCPSGCGPLWRGRPLRRARARGHAAAGRGPGIALYATGG